MTTATTAQPNLGRRTWNFARHFLEMCLAMCVGGAILHFGVFTGIAALSGTQSLRVAYPELSLVVIAILLTAPMAAWMVYRGMPWRPTLEMSAVALGLAIFMIAAAWVGAIPESALQITFGRFCGIACAGMFIVMLFRLDLYTGNHGHLGHGLAAPR
jgi:hypothetical protein